MSHRLNLLELQPILNINVILPVSLLSKNAMQTLVGQFGERLSTAHPPKIINMRQAIPDSGFNDISHMNKNGREIFTNMLDELIQKERVEQLQSSQL